MQNRRCAAQVLVPLLLIHAGLLAWGAVVHSPTIDEVQWLPGGVAQWKTGKFDIVINHPPLVGLVAAIPVLMADPITSVKQQGGFRSSGREFIRANGSRSFWLFTLGRWACIPFSIVGALACFAWARDLYGSRAGLLSATLWCFCPNILAHAQLVTHDVPATSLGLIACYAFWRWLRRPIWANTLITGIGLGLALLTKMTMLIYLFLWPVMWIAWCAGAGVSRRSDRRWVIDGTKLAVIVILGIDLLNLGYGFQGSLVSLDSFSFRSQLLSGTVDGRGNRFADSIFAKLPVPLPRGFVQGVDFQRFALEGGLPHQVSYLRGEWSTRGWPYYYLYALAIKVPLGTWCLLLLSAVFRLRRIDGITRVRDESVLIAPPAALLLVASSSLAWTDHLRHVLPCLPFAFIWISRFANIGWAKHRVLACVGTLALVACVLSSLRVYPHSLSYFNELVGGARYGHYHLLSSNIDFGQDLLKLKRWYDQHPEARPLGLAYWDMDSVDPRIAGIDYFVPASGPRPNTPLNMANTSELGPWPGWYAINVNLLHGDEWPGRAVYPDLGFYGYFLEFTPVASAGYSIYIYHLTVDDVNRVRARLGLPPLESQSGDR